MELRPPPSPTFWGVKNWNENKDMKSEIEVKDILRQPPNPPPIRILMFFESCLYFFCLSRFFYESAPLPLPLSETKLRACFKAAKSQPIIYYILAIHIGSRLYM